MIDTPTRTEIGYLAAGSTAALATLVLLLIEKKVIDKADLVRCLSNVEAEHEGSGSPQVSLASIKHLLHILAR